MFQSQVSRKLLLAFLAAGLVGLAGCSSHPETSATDQPPRATHVKRAAAPAPKPKAEGPKVVPVSAKATQPSGRVITVPKRSEERRVGKECRSRSAQEQRKEKEKRRT